MRIAPKNTLLLVFALAATGFAQTTAPAPAPSAPAQSAPATSAATSAPKVENQESFTVVGLTIRTNNAKEANGQGDIPGLWQGAIQNGTLEQIPNKAGDGYVVVYSDFATDSSGDYNYTLGYRVSSADKVPAGFVAKTIPAGKYAVVASESGPPQEVIPALWQRINSMTPQQLGGPRTYQTDFEIFDPVADWGNMRTVAHIGVK